MKPIALMLSGLAVLLAGCASSGALQAPADYPQLTLKTDETNTLLFTKPGLQLAGYHKVYVAPVSVQLLDGRSNPEVGDDEARQIAQYAERKLKERLAEKLTLVAGPGQDVLSVRFRILDLQPTSSAQLAMMVPPFAMINLVSPKGLFMGSVTIGGELYEGLASEPAVAFVATRSRPGVDAVSAFGKWSAAEKVLDNAAERLANDLGAPAH